MTIHVIHIGKYLVKIVFDNVLRVLFFYEIFEDTTKD